MKHLHSIVRLLTLTILIALFFYFFGLSTLRKGMLKDVVAVSCKSLPFMRFDRSFYCDDVLPTVYPQRLCLSLSVPGTTLESGTTLLPFWDHSWIALGPLWSKRTFGVSPLIFSSNRSSLRNDALL